MIFFIINIWYIIWFQTQDAYFTCYYICNITIKFYFCYNCKYQLENFNIFPERILRIYYYLRWESDNKSTSPKSNTSGTRREEGWKEVVRKSSVQALSTLEPGYIFLIFYHFTYLLIYNVTMKIKYINIFVAFDFWSI